jgi:hypothetical protein
VGINYFGVIQSEAPVPTKALKNNVAIAWIRILANILGSAFE